MAADGDIDRLPHTVDHRWLCNETYYTVMYVSIGTYKILNFPFVPNGKLIILDVPKLRHITVYCICCYHFTFDSQHGRVFTADFGGDG